MSAETASLNAETRRTTGKGASRAARRAGRVPAILYGGADGPLTLSVDRRELDPYAGGRRLIQAADGADGR